LATLAAGTAALAVDRGRTALALLWFPTTILPVSNLLLPIGVLVAERTLYLPSIAVCFGAAALAEMVARRTAAENAGKEAGSADPRGAGREAAPALTNEANAAAKAATWRRAAVAVAVAVAVVLGARTLARIPVWTSTDAVMAALVRDRPDAFRGHWHMARTARVQGDEQRAFAQYARALELWPYRTRLVLEAIGFAAGTGELAYADRLARFAVERWPDNVDARRYLAAVTLDRGDTTAARRYLKEGLRLAPEDSTMLRMRNAIGRR
ncbi:MAG: tetratricopeptide repeat protein, partial [Longimicrobiales bacterium]